ncbi:MAG: F0F1 ATP synthase subunit B [archaeon]|nr:F0F1 ATP synthase subunit B [archaeon]
MGELLHSLGIDGKLLFAQAANFLIILFLLHKFVFPKLLKFLDERKATIAKGIEDGQKAQQELNRVQGLRSHAIGKAQKDADDIRSIARTEAKQEGQHIVSAARESQEEILKKAQEDGQREREGVVKGATEDIGAMAVQLAEKVLAREVTDRDQERMSEEVLAQLNQKYGK